MKKVKVLVAQLCLTFCDPMDYSQSVSVHGIFQARILEWVAISFFRRSSQSRDQTYRLILYCLSHQGRPNACKLTSNTRQTPPPPCMGLP